MHITMREKLAPIALYHLLTLATPVVLLSYKTISIWFALFQTISLSLLFLLLSHDDLPGVDHVEAAAPSVVDPRDAPDLTREDVETVMEIMGMPRGSGSGDRLKERMAYAELSDMFEDKEPSLGEVEAAFAVFDDNRDGTIDAMDLQRVLRRLGFGEGMAVDACQRMIAAYDENKDGRIDFDEFVKIMEGSFR